MAVETRAGLGGVRRRLVNELMHLETAKILVN